MISVCTRQRSRRSRTSKTETSEEGRRRTILFEKKKVFEENKKLRQV